MEVTIAQLPLEQGKVAAKALRYSAEQEGKAKWEVLENKHQSYTQSPHLNSGSRAGSQKKNKEWHNYLTEQSGNPSTN